MNFILGFSIYKWFRKLFFPERSDEKNQNKLNLSFFAIPTAWMDNIYWGADPINDFYCLNEQKLISNAVYGLKMLRVFEKPDTEAMKLTILQYFDRMGS